MTEVNHCFLESKSKNLALHKLHKCKKSSCYNKIHHLCAVDIRNRTLDW